MRRVVRVFLLGCCWVCCWGVVKAGVSDWERGVCVGLDGSEGVWVGLSRWL